MKACMYIMRKKQLANNRVAIVETMGEVYIHNSYSKKKSVDGNHGIGKECNIWHAHKWTTIEKALPSLLVPLCYASQSDWEFSFSSAIMSL